MEWILIVGSVLKIVLLTLDSWIERDKEKRAKKKEILNEIDKELPEAIKSKDSSRINSLINDINQL